MRALHLVSLPLCEQPAAILDVRSPSEFADDHLPGAINLPVLSDTERVSVGTLYKQVSSFEAKRVGAALVARNIAQLLETYFADKPRSFTPLLYCARGGQRSHALATILIAVGWRVQLLDGGYKSYRRYVMTTLEETAQRVSYRVIHGLTGSGKTALLRYLAQQGEQVLDLEHLAAHRSSLLGRYIDRPQPSQRAFESSLAAALEKMDAQRPVYVEAESRKIGNLQVPDALWFRLVASPVVEVVVPEAARVEHLLQEYAHFLQSSEWAEHLSRRLDVLRARYGHERISAWQKQITLEEWSALTVSLLRTHYDPLYSAGSVYSKALAQLPVSAVNEAAHAQAYAELLRIPW